ERKNFAIAVLATQYQIGAGTGSHHAVNPPMDRADAATIPRDGPSGKGERLGANLRDQPGGSLESVNDCLCRSTFASSCAMGTAAADCSRPADCGPPAGWS